MTVRPAKTQISLDIRPVWSESSLSAQWIAKDPNFLYADSEDSDWADAQADLRWAHMPFCWFCHEAAQMVQKYTNHSTRLHVIIWYKFIISLQNYLWLFVPVYPYVSRDLRMNQVQAVTKEFCIFWTVWNSALRFCYDLFVLFGWLYF